VSAPALAECRALVDRVASSSQFARSARLRSFLLYVGHESLKHGSHELHEQEIGVRVFGRSPSYDRSQDNIVRVNATELRRRIDNYFATEGAHEPVVFSIPKGGYKPVFRPREEQPAHSVVEDAPLVLSGTRKPVLAEKLEFSQKKPSPRRTFLWPAVASLLALGCVVLLWQNRDLRRRGDLWAQRPNVARFWNAFIKAAPQTDIVLPDASISMSEEITGQPVSLSDYLDRRFTGRTDRDQMSADRRQALDTIFNHNLVTLGDFHAAQQILSLSPIASSLHLSLARFYEADSMKRDNVILIGGRKANPWVRLFDDQLNFSLEYDNVRAQAFVKNRHPLPNELAEYAPVMDRNAPTAYSVVACLPNPSHTGRIIFLAGTDSDATAAAAEFLTSEDGIQSLNAHTSLSTSPYFEALLKTSRLSGTSFSAELLAIRQHR
jgi:hypothetical protein